MLVGSVWLHLGCAGRGIILGAGARLCLCVYSEVVDKLIPNSFDNQTVRGRLNKVHSGRNVYVVQTAYNSRIHNRR